MRCWFMVESGDVNCTVTDSITMHTKLTTFTKSLCDRGVFFVVIVSVASIVMSPSVTTVRRPK